MQSPVSRGPILELSEVTSTQARMAEILRAGEPVPGAIIAAHQTAGKGRFDRVWIDEPGSSLLMSIAFPEYADHPKPWLIGMAVACAAAAAIHSRLSWPNDLTVDQKKLGGILTELISDDLGRKIPVVGIGINLNQTEFPAEIADRATSLKIIRGSGNLDPRRCADHIFERISLLPEPDSWSDLRPVWMLFDSTPGRRYTLSGGEEAIGIGIGPEGELICSVEGETTTVLAADALFGPA